MRSIDRLKKREGFEDAYTDQFRKLYDDAKKDDQSRISAEALIDAIVVMVEKQDEEMKDDEDEKSVPKQSDAHAPKNRLRAKADQLQKTSPFVEIGKDEIRDDLFNFFEKY